MMSKTTRRFLTVPQLYIWLLLVSAVGAAVLGLVVDSKGFVVNLLAGIVATAFGVWVAVVIIEEILRTKRSTEWQRVRTIAMDMVNESVISIAMSFNDLLPHTSYLAKIKQLQQGQLSDDAVVLGELKDAMARLDPPPEKGKLAGLYQRCSLELDTLAFVVLPVAIGQGEDPEFVGLLQSVHRAYHDWQLVQSQETRQGVSPSYIVDSALKTLTALIVLNDYVRKHSPNP